MKLLSILVAFAASTAFTGAMADTSVYFRVGPSLLGGASSEGTDDPTGATFTSELDGTPLSWPVGRTDSTRLGTYAGATSGWSCDGLSSEPWLSCRFDGGVAVLEGAPPSPGDRSVDIVVRNGAASFPLAARIISPDSASFAVASRPVILDGSSGVPIDVLLGTRTGGSFWSCGGVPGLSWAECVLDDDGSVRLTGTPRVAASGAYFVPIYESGGLVENVEAHASIVAGNDRVAMTGFRSDRLVTRGRPFALHLADYSGGADGWSCAPTFGTLPSWLRCETKDGIASLAGSAPSDLQSWQYFGAAYGISRGESQVGSSSPFLQVYAVDRVITGGEEIPLAPRSGSLTVRNVPSIAVNPRGRVNLDLGAFEGGPEGVSCASLTTTPLYPGMECRVVDGRARLVGEVPETGSRYVNVAVAKDGIVRGQTNLFDVHVVSRTVTGGEETPDDPRVASYAPSRALDRVYLPDHDVDQDLGAFDGGPEGVSCFSLTHVTMHPGTACHVVDGRVRLRGRLPTSGTRQLNLAVVKDGMVLGRSGLHQVDVAGRIVTGGPETPKTPRIGRFSPVAQPNYAVTQGEPLDLDLGAFEGGPEGVGCYTTWLPIPAGLACHVVEGRLRLRGNPEVAGSWQGAIQGAKDSVQLGGTGWFSIDVRPRPGPPPVSGGPA